MVDSLERQATFFKAMEKVIVYYDYSRVWFNESAVKMMGLESSVSMVVNPLAKHITVELGGAITLNNLAKGKAVLNRELVKHILAVYGYQDKLVLRVKHFKDNIYLLKHETDNK